MDMLKISSIFLMIFCLAVISSAEGTTDELLNIGVSAPYWTLKDANDKEYKLSDFKGEILLIIGSDKKGDSGNEIWGEKIAKKYKGRIVIIGMADLQSVPFFYRWKVRADFRDRRDTPSAKYGVPILLDWKGVLAQSYGFKPEVSNLILIDAKGIVRHALRGRYSEEAFNTLSKMIDSLLGEEK
jgi:hypothetical protein